VRGRPGETALLAAVRRRRRAPSFKPDPTNAFELAVAERLNALQKDVDELRGRINWLLTLIIGAALTNIVIALVK